MIKGQKIRLRGLELSDLDRMHLLFNNEEVRQYLLMVAPASKEEEEQFIRGSWELRQKKTDFIFAIETIDEKIYIGNVGLHQIDWINRTSILGIAILDTTYWGQGYGSDALKTTIRYAFDILNLNRIELEVFKSNKRAYRAYLKVGFKEVGRRRQRRYFKGKYEDSIIMDLLKDEWCV